MSRRYNPCSSVDASFVHAVTRLADGCSSHLQWNIPGLKRGPDGYFNDMDLVRLFTESTSEVAGAFKARGTSQRSALRESEWRLTRL